MTKIMASFLNWYILETLRRLRILEQRCTNVIMTAYHKPGVPQMFTEYGNKLSLVLL